MKAGVGAVLFFMLAVPAQAWAGDTRCDTGDGKAVTSLDELPGRVLALLGRDKAGTAGIADIGGQFNPSDAITDASVPMRRLVAGGAGAHCIWLTVEYGGIGHYQKRLEYQLDAHGWTQTKGAQAPWAPAMLPAAKN